MIVVYSNGNETLACSKGDEKRLLKEWFTLGGRNLEEYERTEGRFAKIGTSANVRSYGDK